MFFMFMLFMFSNRPGHMIHALHVDGLMEERRNSIANALELRLSFTNTSIGHMTIASYKKPSGLEYCHVLNRKSKTKRC